MRQASAERSSLVDLLKKGITAAVASSPVLHFPAPSAPLPHAAPLTATDPRSQRTFVLSRADFHGSSSGGGAHRRSMAADASRGGDAVAGESEVGVRATTAHHYNALTLEEAGMCTVNATGGASLTRLVPSGVLVREDYTNNKPLLYFSEKIPGSSDVLAVVKPTP